MNDRTEHLLNSPPLPLLITMAIPNSIAFIVQAGVNMTEVWFVGQLGTTALASIALVFPLLMLSQAISGGAMGGAVASSIARALGGGDVARAEQLVWHALALAGVGALLFLGVFLLFGESFLSFLGGSGEVLSQSMAYCLVLFFGGIFIWCLGVTSAIYRGMGNMQFPAVMMMSSALIQIPISGCLVLGAFGFPQLGLMGAAISVVISGFILSSIMLLRLVFGNIPVKLRRHSCRFSKTLFRDILNVALPGAVSPLLSVVTIISLTAIVASYGESALAGYGIGSRIEFLSVPLIFGLGAAMTSLVGMSIGAKNVARAEHIGWLGGAAAALLSGTAGVLLALFPDVWIPAFTDDPAAHASARDFIQIIGPCLAFQGLGMALYFASQGAGAMRWPVAATILRVILAVGGALLLTYLTDLGVQGVYYAAGLGMVAYGCMIAGALKLGAWRL
ncbi:MAG: MATE family efflux transporter [Pseudomonadota bacterium]